MLDLTNWRSLVRSGASDRETMKLGGWSSPALITRYDEKGNLRQLPEAAVPYLDTSVAPLVANRIASRRLSKKRVADSESVTFPERDTRFERATPSLGSSCSTN
jgi:hypothetical protein